MEALDIVLPVYNEQNAIVRSTRALWSFCAENLDCRWRIVIVNNASEDGTLHIARKLARGLPKVSVIHLDQKGRGRALKKAWSESAADYRCYMDIDLSSELSQLPALVQALRCGYDIAVGSRLCDGANTTRSVFRDVLSRGYNQLLHVVLATRFSDAQCGFKAITSRVAAELLPRVRSQNWFFDTELLVLAAHAGFRILDVPVTWVEDRDSRVNVGRAIVEDIVGIIGLKYRLSIVKERAGHQADGGGTVQAEPERDH